MSKLDGKGKKVIVLGGPTAGGKSELALRLAREWDGILVNADAMQIYADLPILSAQPDASARAQVPHELYGILSLKQIGSAASWAEEASRRIRETEKLVFLVGGTGFYLRALLEGLSPIPDIPPSVQEEGKELLAKKGAPKMHRILAAIDPIMADRLHPNDSQRIWRAWCVQKASHRSLAFWQDQKPPIPPFNAYSILLLPERSALYRLCDDRFLRMLEAGALEEVEVALQRYGPPDYSRPGYKTLGFRELAEYLQGTRDRGQAIAAAQQKTRNYAKRQYTWFRHQIPDGYLITNYGNINEILERKYAEIVSNINDFLLTNGKKAG